MNARQFSELGRKIEAEGRAIARKELAENEAAQEAVAEQILALPNGLFEAPEALIVKFATLTNRSCELRALLGMK